jgi:hypothetical protein
MAKEKGTYSGPETHVSPDQTTNNVESVASDVSGDKILFQKYKYQAIGEAVVVESADDEAALLGEWFDAPVEPKAETV